MSRYGRDCHDKQYRQYRHNAKREKELCAKSVAGMKTRLSGELLNPILGDGAPPPVLRLARRTLAIAVFRCAIGRRGETFGSGRVGSIGRLIGINVMHGIATIQASQLELLRPLRNDCPP